MFICNGILHSDRILLFVCSTAHGSVSETYHLLPIKQKSDRLKFHLVRN